ncbi:hypothetical protein FHT36_001908 [Xanthobacter sp. SG618]|uniref:hypothetical protein n=1 Tax=Xanthobacter sp. SG618 TaxID=2587121 RepID=UPI00145D60E6|nr:hypothetical protein [Xanthobacter sp. SG618]NMN58006.1 hypothetical protein [Xanthobacter sp. SG618]
MDGGHGSPHQYFPTTQRQEFQQARNRDRILEAFADFGCLHPQLDRQITGANACAALVPAASETEQGSTDVPDISPA